MKFFVLMKRRGYDHKICTYSFSWQNMHLTILLPETVQATVCFVGWTKGMFSLKPSRLHTEKSFQIT